MINRIVSISLCIVLFGMMAMPSAAMADRLIYQYPSVQVWFESTGALEEEFREWIKEIAKLYFEEYCGGRSSMKLDAKHMVRYYYEASEIKHAYDEYGQTKGMAGNTVIANNPDEVYRQETKNAYFKMIIQDMQRKVEKMEGTGYFPGAVFDPTTGEWRIDNVAKVYNLAYEDSIKARWDELNWSTGTLFVKSVADIILACTGYGAKGTAFNVTTALKESATEIAQEIIRIEKEEREKAYHNMIREFMIDQLMQAYNNICEEVYAGFETIQLELKHWNSVDSVLYDEALGKAMEAINKLDQKEILSKTFVDEDGRELTVEEKIELVATLVIDDLGMNEAYLRTEEQRNLEIAVAVFQAGIRAAAQAIIREYFGNQKIVALDAVLINTGASIIADAVIDVLFAEFVDPVVLQEADCKDVSSAIEYVCDRVITDESVESAENVLREEVEKLVFNYGGNTADKGAEKLTDQLLSNWAEELGDNKAVYDQLSFNQQVLSTMDNYGSVLFYRRNEQMLDNASKKIIANSEKIQHLSANKGYIGSIIYTLVDVVKAANTTFSIVTEMNSMYDNEQYWSVVAANMYRIMQMAKIARAIMEDKYAHYRIEESIDTAPVEELKGFAEMAALILNTDMLGHSYYTTLDVNYFACKNHQDASEMLAEWWNYSWERYDVLTEQYGSYTGTALTLYGAGLLFMLNLPEKYFLGMPEYFAEVQNKSTIGSWIAIDRSQRIYERMADIAVKLSIPTKFKPLF